MKTPGDPMGSQPYGTPSPFEKDVVKNIPTDLPQYQSASGRTPLQDLDGARPVRSDLVVVAGIGQTL
jgi:sulfane dehydrogenase subunit SoxC